MKTMEYVLVYTNGSKKLYYRGYYCPSRKTYPFSFKKDFSLSLEQAAWNLEEAKKIKKIALDRLIKVDIYEYIPPRSASLGKLYDSDS
jgi:predicted component of viral defense system (DUF524 family)